MSSFSQIPKQNGSRPTASSDLGIKEASSPENNQDDGYEEDVSSLDEDENPPAPKRSLQKDGLSLNCTPPKGNGGSHNVPDTPDSDGDILGVLDHSPDAFDNSVTTGHRFIPYSRVFEALRFTELMAHVFVRNQPVTVRVVKMEILPSAINIFNQCMFTIILQHGTAHWTVTRRSRQIASLHNQLRLFKTKLRLPAATSEERERRQSMRIQIRGRRGEEGSSGEDRRLVKFPRKSLQRMDKYTEGDVEQYLNNLLHHSLLRNHCAVVEFFEISPVSFVGHLGPKLKEGFVKKRVGGRNDIVCCGGRFKRRWLVVRETCLFCISPNAGSVRTVMLFDSGFQISHGFMHTRISNGLHITNLSRSLVLKCEGEESAKDFSASLEQIRKSYALDFSQLNRHLSFAPVRKHSHARWYVDGAWYMNDVADLLETAQEEIFITGWWLSPDIYMKRPDLTGKQWKLNEILRRQAVRGVKVFILLYKEVELALGLNSLYTKQNLCQMSANIYILRHPDHYKGSLYWAHHEKMVIIDQMYAFVGGIDLCYGRWDDYRHKLVDIGHAGRVVKGPDTLGQLILSAHNLFTKSVAAKEEGREAHLQEDEVDKTATKNDLVLNAIQEHKLHDEIHSGSKTAQINGVNSSCSEQSSSSEAYAKDSDCDIYAKNCTADQEGVPATHSSNANVATGVALPVNPKYNAACDAVHPDYTKTTTPEVTDDSSDSSYDAAQPSSASEVGRRKSQKIQAGEEEAEILPKSEQTKSRGRMSRNFKAVKNLGLDLVGEMKEKKKEMKNWTEKKVPKFRRSGSQDSEINLSSSSEDDDGEKKKSEKISRRFGRKLKRRLRARGKPAKEPKLGATGSLIDLHKELAHEEVNSVHLWIGKDYVNWITRDLYDPQIPFIDTVNRHETPRMPWHDIALYVEGAAARDAARHFIQRWNAVKSEKTKNNDRYVYLLPRTYQPSSFVPSILQPKHRVKCQVVRSLGGWNGGIGETERSIYNAYIDAIQNSKHYIYIENQFFISSASVTKAEVINSVAYHLFQRIVKAHRDGQTFRVYVVVPLLPAFEGQIGTPSGVAMQYILHYCYQSIVRGPNSLIGMLDSAKITWQRYLSFCSLRTHDTLEGRLVSELIYIHSKLIIVDDRLVIAGSANINDRSLMGNRDSEVNLVIEDEEFTKGIMNGSDYRRGKFAGSLRMYLFTEHLGVSAGGSSIDVSDPVSEQFFIRTWQGTASRNTKIYDEVFSCIPCDTATTFAELKRLRSQVPLSKKSPDKARQKLKDIQGRLVLYPLMFLKDENLKPGPTNKEYLLPNDMWL